MRYFYSFLLILLVPFIMLRLFWKARKLPAYRQRIAERFSFVLPPVSDVWIHAVSLGEVIAATGLIEHQLQQGRRVMVTTMTPTGSAQVIKRFGQRVNHQYLPYDFPWAVRRFLRKMKAKIGIIFETELWPNLIYEAKIQHLPLLLVNARISDKAFPSYQRSAFFFKPLLACFKAILAQSSQDAERFTALGAPADCIKVMGNLKFDVEPAPNAPLINHIPTWKNRVVWLAVSTHEDEEAKLLSQLNALKSRIPNVLLLLAPRHPERFDAVFSLCKANDFNTVRRTQVNEVGEEVEILLLDSLGEMHAFFPHCDYVFVGGSLVPIGGHNVLEPMAFGLPVCCGPFMQNSQAICSQLLEAKALVMVQDALALRDYIEALHTNAAQRQYQIDQAFAALKANQGALNRYIEIIEEILREQGN